jgi:hypothetical protein
VDLDLLKALNDFAAAHDAFEDPVTFYNNSRSSSSPGCSRCSSSSAGGKGHAPRSPPARAALVIAAVALREGRESWRGEACCDSC